MISIRRGVFETNSSSSHSIAINSNSDKIAVDRDYILENFINGKGMWKMDNPSFGRAPFRYLSKFYEKVCYVYEMARYKDTLMEELENIVEKYIPEFKGFTDVYDSGYSEGDVNLTCFLADHNISLEDFLVNEKYIIICDGDEYNIFMDMVHLGIVNKNTVDTPYNNDENEEFEEED